MSKRTLHSFADLADLRNAQIRRIDAMRLALNQRQAMIDTLAARRVANRRGSGFPVISEATLTMAARPLPFNRNEPALAGRTYNPKLHIWERTPKPPERPQGRPAQGYRPVSLSEGTRWQVRDKATGASLWLVQGPFNHVRREASKAARSLGFAFTDLYMEIIT